MRWQMRQIRNRKETDPLNTEHLPGLALNRGLHSGQTKAETDTNQAVPAITRRKAISEQGKYPAQAFLRLQKTRRV